MREKLNLMPQANIFQAVLEDIRKGFWAAAALSCVINLLMLTGPLFMLQVYDRVLVSRSVPTLVALLTIVISLYSMSTMFDLLRARTLSRISQWIDDKLAEPIFRQWIVRQADISTPGYKPVSDLSAVRGLVGSPSFAALFDIPWFPLYLAIVYILHFKLGLLATAGAIIVTAIAIVNELLTSRGTQKASIMEMAEGQFSDEAYRNADCVVAMGMLPATTSHWRQLRDSSLRAMQAVSEKAELLTSLSKGFRMFLQSAMLALAAYLVIQQEVTSGAIVASSILSGRALSPIDQFIGGWKQIKRSRLAYARLKEFLARQMDLNAKAVVKLPDPSGNIALENIVKFAPGRPGAERVAIIAGLSFSLAPGDGLGVIGPSASGKSTLAKLLAGVWMPDQGSVRLDGATFDQWGNDAVGQFIGYLPQSYELLPGTIAQNIARFGESEQGEVVEAAQLAGVHEVILSFPDGYATRVGDRNSPLTGGQKQRIALARALFRRPKLVILDEPNSNLDAEGDAALANAIVNLRQSGSVVVVMAHRPSAIAAVDKILMLKDGTSVEFGMKDEVLKRVIRSA